MQNKQKCLITILTFVLIMLTTFAYSSLATNLAITGEAMFRTPADIRVTNISLDEANGATNEYEPRFTKDTITSGFTLNSTTSSISYTVRITNSGLRDQAIYNLITQSSNNSGLSILIDGVPINQALPIIVPYQDYRDITITYSSTSPGRVDVVNRFDFREVYYISYNTKGGSSVATQTKYKNVDLTLAGTPTKSGYRFLGWTDEQNGEVVKFEPGDTYTIDGDNKILYAIYELNVAEITLSGNVGGTEKIYQKYNDGFYLTNNNGTLSNKMTTSSNPITVPQKDGYKFEGYYTQANGQGTKFIESNGKLSSTASSTQFNANGSLYAYYTPYKLTINYYANGAQKDNGTTINNQKLTTDTYDYDGTDLASTGLKNYDGGTGATWNLTKIGYTASKYYHIGSANNSTKVHENTNYAKIQDLATAMNKGEDLKTSDVEVNIYAGWTANTYQVSFNANGGTGTMSNQSFTYNEALKALTTNAFTRAGYTFTGWNTSADGQGDAYLNEEQVQNLTSTNNATIILYAQWTVNTYAVTYDYNTTNYDFDGSNYIDTKYTVDWDRNFKLNSTVNIPTLNQRYLLFGNYNSNKELNLEFSDANKLRVYSQGDIGLSSQTITNNTDIALDFNYSANNKSFIFTSTGTNSNASATGTNDKTGVAAQSLRIGTDNRTDGTFKPYTLKQASITDYYTYGSKVTRLPNTPTKPGYTFVGWYSTSAASGGTEITTNTDVPTSNVTYYARWTPNNYTVTANSDGGTIASTSGWTGTGDTSTKSVTYDSTYGTLPTISKAGYSLEHWYKLPKELEKIDYLESSGSNYINSGVYPSSDFRLVADVYLPSSATGERTFAGIRYNDSAVEYYFYNGEPRFWNTSGSLKSGSAMYDQRIKYDAIYNSTGMKLSINDSVVASNDIVYTGQQNYPITLFAHSNAGSTMYYFIGRVYGLQMYSNGILVRDYIPVNRKSDNTKGLYDIVENKFYMYGSNSPVQYSENVITSSTIVKTSSNHDIYAKWATNTYQVAFNANGGTGTMSNQSFTYGAAAKALTTNAFTRTGYTFIGWNTSADGQGDAYLDEEQVQNLTSTNNDVVTLYAQWLRNDVQVTLLKDGSIYSNSGMQVTLYNGTTATSHSATVSSGSTATFTEVVAGTYNIYVGKDSNHKTTLIDSNVDVTVPKTDVSIGNGNTSTAIVNYYTLTLNKDSNTTTVNGAGVYLSNQTASISATAFATNYEFDNWTKTEGNTPANANSASTTVSMSAKTTLTANAKLSGYSITFNANGGTGTMSNQVIPMNTSATIKANTFTKSGETFIGWNTQANGQGTAYLDEEEITPTGNMTLYAQWQEVWAVNLSYSNENTFIPCADAQCALDYIAGMVMPHTITYNANGGTGTMSSQTVNANDSVTLTTNVFTKSGSTFEGWNTKANGTGKSYSDGQTITPTENMTLYAQWDETTGYTTTIRYNANGGTYTNDKSLKSIGYRTETRSTTSYSYTQNIDETGARTSVDYQNGAGKYGNMWDNKRIVGTGRTALSTSEAHVITVSGSESLTVDIYYNGESTRYDWACVWAGSHPAYLAKYEYSSSVSGKLGGSQSGSYTVNGNSLTNMGYQQYTITGDSVTFGFYSDGGVAGDGYGYYAIITGTEAFVASSTTYEEPTRKGYTFGGWYTDTDYTTEFTLDSDNIPTDLSSTTVYAKWIQQVFAKDLYYNNSNSGINCTTAQCVVDYLYSHR